MEHFGIIKKISGFCRNGAAGHLCSKKGQIMSVEALFAALILFGTLLLISSLNSLSHQPQEQTALREFSQDIPSSLQRAGAFSQMIDADNDSILNKTMKQFPPSICANIKIYSANTAPTSIIYSYSSNCTLQRNTPVQKSMRSMARRSSYSISKYFIETEVFAGG